MSGRAATALVIRFVLVLLTTATRADVAPLSLHRLADGVYVHGGAQAEASPANRGDIANIGFVVGRDCVAVIDSGGSLLVGQALLSAIRAITPLPICFVINTHVHPDHIFGNAAFVDEHARFVSHARLPAAMAARRDSYQAALIEQIWRDAAQGSRMIAPTELIATGGDLTLDLGERKLNLHAWPTSHTDADLSIFDAGSGTLWTGDLLFVDRIPVIDGSVLGWLRTMDALAATSPCHIVPGHGPLDSDWQLALAAQRRYLDVLVHDVRTALKANLTLQQTVDQAGLSERGRWRLFEDYNRRNVTASYTELEWEN